MSETFSTTTLLSETLPARRTSLRANFSWTVAGTVIHAACQWAALVLLARLGTPEMVGQYSFGLAVTLPIFGLASLQLRNVVTTDVTEATPFGEYLSFRLLTTLAALTVTLIIPFALGYGPEGSAIIVVVGIAQAIEAISDIYYSRLQFHDHMDRIAISLIVRSFLSVAAFAGALYLTGRVLWAVVGWNLARTAVLIFYDAAKPTHQASPLPNRDELGTRMVSQQLRPRWNSETHRQLFLLSLPLGVVSLLVSLYSQIPRYFIEDFLGAKELGIFSAMAFLAAAGNLVVTALGQSAFVRLAKLYAAGDKSAFVSMLSKLLGIGALFGGLGVMMAAFAGPQLLTFLYGSMYTSNAELLTLIMMAGAISYLAVLTGVALTSARIFKPQIPLLVVVCVTCTCASFWLVPSRGLRGAGLAMIITSAVLLAGEAVLMTWALTGRQSELSI
jgi:O-antigen/teichoic acid export membrane protein